MAVKEESYNELKQRVRELETQINDNQKALADARKRWEIGRAHV